MRSQAIVVIGGLLLALGLQPLTAVEDELKTLIAHINPPARFADHKPAFSIVEFEHTFEFSDGPKVWKFFGIKDGDRFVAYVPKVGFHGGSIFILTHDPAETKTELDLPSERFHIDTARGASFRTDHFLPSKDWGKAGEQSEWIVAEDGSTVTLKRSYTGELATYKWELNTSKSPIQVDHTGTFVLSFDPVLGYVIDGSWSTGTNNTKQLGQYVSLYPQDMSNPWITEGIHKITMTCPEGSEGYIGHANNHPSIHHSDDRDQNWSIRNGGFTAYLNENTGWSWAMSLLGAQAKLGVCNVHADQDLIVRWPSAVEEKDNGLKYHTVTARHLRLPPEITAHLLEKTEVRFKDRRMVVIPVGKLADFEDQPMSMGEARIGMTWAGSGPEIRSGDARSGDKAMVVKGHVFPNLPQIVLKPNQKYRIEGWYKVSPATEGDIAALKQKHEKNEVDKIKRWEKAVKKAEKKKQDPPPKPEPKAWQEPGKATAYITAHLYRWSPHNAGDRVLEQITSKAEEDQGWQQVALEFTAPAWGPFVDIRFITTGGGMALLDDFQIIEVSE